MAGSPLRGMPLDPQLVGRLEARRFSTARDVLCTTPLDLMEHLDLPAAVVQTILHTVAAVVMPPPVTVLQMLHLACSRMTHLATQLTALDEVLRGGIPCNGITELIGPAGIGKTQLCLQLTAVAASLGVGQSDTEPGVVVYIDTERKFSAQRLMQIAVGRCSAVQDPTSLKDLTSRVAVIAPGSSAELLSRLQAIDQDEGRPNIRLIVVDSIAALARLDFGRPQVSDRQHILGQQASMLKRLAEKLSIPVIAVNQVTTAFREAPQHDVGSGAAAAAAAGGGHLTAALGVVWAHAVNTRLVLEASGGTRYIKVAKSPTAPLIAFAYRVTGRGLELLDQPPLTGLKLGSALGLHVHNDIQYEPPGFAGEGLTR